MKSRNSAIRAHTLRSHKSSQATIYPKHDASVAHLDTFQIFLGIILLVIIYYVSSLFEMTQSKLGSSVADIRQLKIKLKLTLFIRFSLRNKFLYPLKCPGNV